MRSMYCLGAAEGLLLQGKLDNLHGVFTSSAGCVAGLVVAASRLDSTRFSHISERLFARLVGKRFIDARRFRRVVDVEFLADVLVEELELTPDLIAETVGIFEVGMTAKDGRSAYVDLAKQDSANSIREAIIASMAIPLFFPPKARYRGERYFDGGIADPLPVLRAMEVLGTSDVIAVSNVPRLRLGRPASTFEAIVLHLVPGIPAPVRYQILGQSSLGTATDRLLDLPSLGGFNFLRVTPDADSDLGGRLNTDLDHLLRLKELGIADSGYRAPESADSRPSL